MDPVTLAVVRGSLEQIADEMDLHLIHAAISPIISETNDCANGIFHPITGETIAQGRYGLPVFLAYMQFTVQTVIGMALKDGGFKPGDMWILNDPYIGGSHLQDVQLIAPVFVDGELFAVMATTGHWMDIGGNVPGGWAPRATEIHQEGIIIPPVRLYDEGKLNKALVSMFKANVRLPSEIAGDLAAMSNTFSVGTRGIEALVKRYGRTILDECLNEMIAYSERQMRSYIAEIPDGTYAFEDYFDNDGIIDEPIRINLAITVTGDDMHFDFTGTGPTSRGPLNMSRNTTLSSCYVAIKHIFPDVPVNGGTFRPIHFTLPDNTLLSAQYPAAVGGYLDPVGRVIDVVFGTLSKVIPEKSPAAFFGTTGVVTVSGVHPRTKNYFVGVFPYPGGYGATQASDGLINGNPPQSMANFMSLEMSEHRFPLRFDYFKIRDDSGGAGWHRGGCGTEYGFTAWSDCIVSVLGDRVDYAPFGIVGGGPAAANNVEFVTQGKTWKPELRSKQEKEPFTAGDSIRAASPGGGGFGNALDRDLLMVERDLNRGYISRETAEKSYGVVVGQAVALSAEHTRFQLDPIASATRRQTLQKLLVNSTK
ncbi:hydantoinase B/oxoprolinase family protein [Glaciimonas sp. Gout2]|uniref:hydantoinase B/oxoprolinase family protein n=1 Tax=unclassified Glaciimonas TaxID=2644401 RepID=UPI002B229CC0|nr:MULTISPECIES: hydantoinase B/oxoprolinase family protein [unclassified Glaciimonas]MEB0012342.1 hydantoinase B/oxoprolinase family protein [Glaciimonas sp. Cout2]MEB0080472.1 hydantoinase B/oxoprolinase family protein [Glaciimonas sp. Gout2]